MWYSHLDRHRCWGGLCWALQIDTVRTGRTAIMACLSSRKPGRSKGRPLSLGLLHLICTRKGTNVSMTGSPRSCGFPIKRSGRIEVVVDASARPQCRTTVPSTCLRIALPSTNAAARFTVPICAVPCSPVHIQYYSSISGSTVSALSAWLLNANTATN